MDALSLAAPLARLLLTQAEAGRTGELLVTQPNRAARLALVGGRLSSLAGLEVAPLGDTLHQLGELPRSAAWPESEGGVRIGERLLRAGVLTETGLTRALHVQLGQKIEALLRYPALEVTFTPEKRPGRAAWGPGSSLAALVWAALARLSEQLPRAEQCALAGSEALALTPAGERRWQRLVRETEPLRVLGCALVEGAPEALQRSLLAAQPSEGALCLRAILRALGLVTSVPEREQSYALLLRKRRELARHAGPATLLDLERDGTPAEAHEALRRLARVLHPDRFSAGDPRLCKLSGEVMGALVGAARALSSSRVRAAAEV